MNELGNKPNGLTTGTIVNCAGCREAFQDSTLKDHLVICDNYPNLNSRTVRNLPEQFSVPNLKVGILESAIVVEIDLCCEQIKTMIDENNVEKNGNNMMDQGLRVSGSVSSSINRSAFNQNAVQCPKCRKNFYATIDRSLLFYVEECWHMVCKSCMNKYFDKNFVNNGGNLQCLVQGCSKEVPEFALKKLVGEKKYDVASSKAIRKLMNLVQCVKCKSQYEFVSGNIKDAPCKDQNGRQITHEEKQDYVNNRFVCPEVNCKSEQCKQCRIIPYHSGMTCEKFKERAHSMKCRYCDQIIIAGNNSNSEVPALQDICNAQQCQQTAKTACTKILACGHPCPGVKGEVNCLPCLKESCAKDDDDLNGHSGDDYCNICFIEALSAAPCIQSSCGHIFHERCVRKRYQVKWLTPRILFNFCLCPLCMRWIDLPKQNPLTPKINKYFHLFKRIQSMALQRLRFQSCDKDERLTNPESPYFEKPVEYAMAIYAYFLCYKCRMPYFGGRKSCVNAMNEPNDQGQFKLEELVCSKCCNIPMENCPKHGHEFIEFKCKFCCSISQWFCWNTTHFCESCHLRQCKGDYVSRYPKEKLPKCKGPTECPIGGNHNGNGMEKSLGCTICRNIKANGKQF